MAYDTEVLADSPQVWWRMDETSGTGVLDHAGTFNAATVGGAVVRNIAGLITAGKAITITGGDGVFGPIGAAHNHANFTAEVWFKATSFANSPIVMAHDQDGATDALRWRCYVGTDGKPAIVTRDVTTAVVVVTSDGPPLSINQTYHLVLTYDGSAFRFYINGVQHGSAKTVASLNAPGFGRLEVGAIYGLFVSSPLAGTVDEFAYYPTALSLTRVAAHYAAGITQDVVSRNANLVGYGYLDARTYRTGWLVPTTITGWTARRRYGNSGTELDTTVEMSPFRADGRPLIWAGEGVDGYNSLYRLTYSGAELSLAGATQVHVEWYLNGSDGAGATCKLIVNGTPYTSVSQTTVDQYRTRTRFDVSGITTVTSVAVEWENLDDRMFRALLERIDRIPEPVARAANLTGSGAFTATVVRVERRAGSFTGTGTFTATAATGAPSTVYPDTVLADSPLAYYRLGESSGTTMVDASGNGRHGVYSGGLTLGSTGLDGSSDKAITFNGTDAQGRVEGASWMDVTTAYTLEALVKPQSLTGQDTIVSRHGVKGSPLILRFDNNVLALYNKSGFPGTFESISYAGSFVAGTRYHVAATFDAGVVKLYVNGAVVASKSFTFTSLVTTNTDVPLVIGGAAVVGSPEFFDGVIDEVAYYGTALPAQRIAAHYVAATSVATAYPGTVLADSPLAYYRQDGASGTMVDSSGNGRDGVYENTGNLLYGQASLLVGDLSGSAVRYTNNGRGKVTQAAWMDTAEMSIEVWVKVTSLTGVQTISNRRGTLGNVFQLRLNAGKAEFLIWTDAASVYTVTAPTALALGNHHIVATSAGTAEGNPRYARLFVDGAQVAQMQTAALPSGPVNIPPSATNRPHFWVGYNDLTDNEFPQSMTLDEVALYGVKLSAAQITTHYQVGMGIAQPAKVTAALTGTGAFTATVVPVERRSAPLTGSGTFTATVAVVGTVPQVGAALTGSGIFTATTGAVVVPQVVAALTGHGSFTATVDGEALVPAYLLVITPEVEQTPGTITVAVANVEPLTEVTFTIDGIEVGTEIADANGMIVETTVPVARRFGEGEHTVTATTVLHTASGAFVVITAADALPETPAPSTPPVRIPDTVNKWVFQDLMPGGLGSWVMPINPASMNNPHVRKTIAVAATTAVRGRPHLSEGATPVEWEFSGFAPNKAFQDQLIAYSELPYRFYIVDHRGRAWVVAITRLSITARKRTKDDRGVANDWLADYTVAVALFSQTPQELA